MWVSQSTSDTTMESEELDFVRLSCVPQSPHPGGPRPSWDLDTPELFSSSRASNQNKYMLRCVEALMDIYTLAFSD